MKKFLPIPFLLVLLLIAISKAPVISSPFSVYINNTGSLGFQNQIGRFLRLDVTSGAINSSVAALTMDSYTGRFRFTANESCSFQVTYNVTRAGVSGIATARNLPSGATVNVLANDPVNIYWNIDIEPLLPVMFILGMIGLCSMVGGGFYGAHKIKKGEYYEGGRMALIYIAVGFGLFIAWVFMGA